MSLKIEDIRYGQNNVYSAYAAYPALAKLPLPAVVVIQEAWGLDEHIEDVTRRFARAGYVAFAPDVFARAGKRPEALTRERLAEVLEIVNTHGQKMFDPEARKAALANEPKEKVDRLVESMTTLFGGLGKPEHVDPVLAATSFLRDSYAPSKGRKVGTIGFCMGGKLSAQAAVRDPRLACAAVFYGAPPDEEGVKKISCPVMTFVGKTDAHIMGAIPAFAEAMKKHGKSYEQTIYEHAGHGFFNDRRPSYDVDATRDSLAKVLSFFQANLV